MENNDQQAPSTVESSSDKVKVESEGNDGVESITSSTTQQLESDGVVDTKMEDSLSDPPSLSSTNETSKSSKKLVKIVFKLKNPDTNEVITTTSTVSKKLLDRKKLRGGVSINPTLAATAQLPVKFGSAQVVDLGVVDFENSAFHTDKYIFPVGFKSERVYPSYMNADNKVTYTCEILKENDQPVFKITAADDVQHPITSQTATGAWTHVIKKLNANRSKPLATVSGPEYFGLSHQKVRQLIELLPNADRCETYQMQFNYDERGELDPNSAGLSRKKRNPKKKSSSDDAEPSIASSRTKRAKRKSTVMESEDVPDAKRRKKTPSTSTSKVTTRSQTKQHISDEEVEVETTPATAELFEGVKTITEDPLPDLLPFEFRFLSANLAVYPGNYNAEYYYMQENNYTDEEVLQKYQDYHKMFAHTLHSKQKQSQNQFLDKLLEQQKLRKKSRRKAIQKKTENITLDSEVSEIEELNSMWEFAYLCYCFVLLRPVLKFMDFEVSDLEKALLNPTEHNALLADIHVKLVKGPALDNKSHTYLEPDCVYWKTILKNKLDVIEERYWLWKVNPLLNKTYEELPVVWRVIVLKALMEWKFDKSNRVFDYTRKKYDSTMRVLPLGSDIENNLYWYFGEEIGRMYIESPPVVKEVEQQNKRNRKPKEPEIVLEKKGQWKLVCSSKEEFLALADKFASSEHEQEQELSESIVDNIIPNLDAYEYDKARIKLENEEKELQKQEKAKTKAKKKQEKEEREEKERKEEEEVAAKPAAPVEAKVEPRPVANSMVTPTKQGGIIFTDYSQQFGQQGMLPFNQMSPQMYGQYNQMMRTPTQQQTQQQKDAPDSESKRSLRPRRQRFVYKDVEDDDEPKKAKGDDDDEFKLSDDEEEDDFQVDEEDDADEEYEPPQSPSTPTGRRGRGRPPGSRNKAPSTPQPSFESQQHQQQMYAAMRMQQMARGRGMPVQQTMPGVPVNFPPQQQANAMGFNLNTREGVQMYLNMYKQRQMMQQQQLQQQSHQPIPQSPQAQAQGTGIFSSILNMPPTTQPMHLSGMMNQMNSPVASPMQPTMQSPMQPRHIPVQMQSPMQSSMQTSILNNLGSPMQTPIRSPIPPQQLPFSSVASTGITSPQPSYSAVQHSGVFTPTGYNVNQHFTSGMNTQQQGMQVPQYHQQLAPNNQFFVNTAQPQPNPFQYQHPLLAQIGQQQTTGSQIMDTTEEEPDVNQFFNNSM